VDLQVYDNESSCSQLCQCSLNDTVVCQSLPCTHSVACTHLNTVYGQLSYSAPVVKQKYCAIPARSVGRVLIQGRRQVKLCGVERHGEREPITGEILFVLPVLRMTSCLAIRPGKSDASTVCSQKDSQGATRI